MASNQRKPGLLAKLLGTPLERTEVRCEDIVPRGVWLGNPAIQEWGLCWRVDATKRVEIACSIMLKGNMMPGHGCVMAVEENGENVDILISLMPIGNPNGKPDYVAVSLLWRKCTERVCGTAAMEQGMTFDESSPSDIEEFMSSWAILNAARINVNMYVQAASEREEAAAKEKEKGKKNAAPSRKRKAATGTGEGGDHPVGDEQAIGEGSKPKRKAKAAQGKELTLTLDEALSRGNRMSTKTKDTKIGAIYKALEVGLGHAFPYRKRRLPGVIPSERLHIAPDELKYRKIAKERLGQVKTIYKGYGAIKKKPEIHGIPLKRAPTEADSGMDVVMESIPDEDAMVRMSNGSMVPWWKHPDIHLSSYFSQPYS